MSQHDIFDIFNRVFGNMDVIMRDLEKEFHTPNLLPRITLPGIKTYYSEQRALTNDGVTTYYDNGRVSKLGGPAVVYADEREDEYWIDGKRISKEEHDKMLVEYEDNKIHTVYIDGKPNDIPGKKLKLLRQMLEDE